MSTKKVNNSFYKDLSARQPVMTQEKLLLPARMNQAPFKMTNCCFYSLCFIYWLNNWDVTC